MAHVLRQQGDQVAEAYQLAVLVDVEGHMASAAAWSRVLRLR